MDEPPIILINRFSVVGKDNVLYLTLGEEVRTDPMKPGVVVVRFRVALVPRDALGLVLALAERLNLKVEPPPSAS